MSIGNPVLVIILIFLVNLTFAQNDLVWHSIGPGGSGWFTKVAVDTLNPGTVFAGADVGGFYKSTDYGRSWRICNTGLIDYYVEDIAIDPVNSQVVYLGTWGGVHKSTDGGETWQNKRNGFPPPSNSNYTAPVRALAIDPQNHCVLYAGIGMIRLGPNDVGRWGPVRVKGAVFKSTDAGESWRMIRNTGIDTTAMIYSLEIDPTNSSILYATTHLGVYKSTDAGETWMLKNTGLPPIPDSTSPRDIVVDPSNPDRLYLTFWSDYYRNTGIWKSTNGGEVWLPCTTGISKTNFEEIVINAKNPAVLYASSTYGITYGVYRTTNRGNSWDTISNGNVKRGWVRFYPQQPTGFTLNQQDTTMLFYTSASGVFKTTNLGLEWQPCYTESIGPDDNWKGTGLEITCIRQIAVDPVDSNLIYVALYDGGLLKTTDRGYSFKWIQDDMFSSDTIRYPNNTTFSVAIHPRASEILYASAGRWDIPYSKLWRSTDYGETWVRCSNGLPDSSHKSPIFIDPNSTRDSTVIYLWASRYGVYKSTDAGQSWVLKNNGLGIPPGSDSFVHDHPQIMAINNRNPSTLYLCVPKRSKVYKTTDGGDSWFPLTLPANLEPWGIALNPLNGNKVYLWTKSSGAGGVYRSTDGGQSWEPEPKFEVRGYLKNEVRCLGVNPFDTNLVILGMNSYAQRDSSTGWGVFMSTDGGETWQEANQGLGSKRIYNLTFDSHNSHIIWLGTAGTGVYRGEYKIPPPVLGWQRKADLLSGPRNKKVKAGGCLVRADSLIYALKGNNTVEFYKYNLFQDTWFLCCSLLVGENRKKVKNGAALCYDGRNSIYALKGNNTLEFWVYDITNDLWIPKKNVPLGVGKKIKGGGGLVFVNKADSNLVFCLKGSKTREFYVYYVERDTWLKRKDAPAGLSQKGFDKGSCIAFDGSQTIYVLKAKYNEFYAYDISSDSWKVKKPLPIANRLGKKKKAKDGASITYDPAGVIYAFKGGNTQEFWAYNTVSDTWLEQETIPRSLSGKRVRSGGSLCYAVGDIYALKGNNTLEFWRYTPKAKVLTRTASFVMTTAKKSNYPFALYQNTPNPFKSQTAISYSLPTKSKILLQIFDVSGRLVRSFVEGEKESGVYTLNWDGKDDKGRKVVQGVYFATLELLGKRIHKKMLLLR